MTDYADVIDLPDDLGALDTLLYRGESNPRTRSGIIGVELLETAPDWERFRDCFDQASRRVLRMRQKVVAPTIPTAAPRWVVDPDFDLDFHVRRARVPGDGTLRELLDMADLVVQAPIDVARPLWSVTLVEGLRDGRAGVLLHLSHALSDGMGGVELFRQLYDLEPDPPPRPATPVPIPEDISAGDLAREGAQRLPASLVRGVGRILGAGVQSLGKLVSQPRATIGGVLGYATSAARMMEPAAPPSPILSRRGLASRTEAIDIPFADLRRAAKAVGGSINDVYLAGLCTALRRYHEDLGVHVDTLPMAVPVSLRTDDDPAGGNRFTGVTLAAPLSERDPAECVALIRAQMISRREEPAIDAASFIAPVLSMLPTAVVNSLAGNVTPPDVQASNVPVYLDDTYIAGARVLRQYGIGPLPGIAMMVVLITRSNFCTVTVRYDRASIVDTMLFARSLQQGFDEILALADDPAARSVPATFPDVEHSDY